MSQLKYTLLPTRQWIKLSGPDVRSFLQGLVTQDTNKLQPGALFYSLLLTPQGKFLHDLFLQDLDENIWIDCEDAEALCRRLTIFKLRAQITLEIMPCVTVAVWGGEFVRALKDPRHPDMSSRLRLPKDDIIVEGAEEAPFEIWDQHRLRLGIPDGRRDMIPEKSIPLECNMDRLNTIDWDKGCYMGQELTARTHYRGLVRKRLMPVEISGPAPAWGTPILQGDQEVGELRSSSGPLALAMIRLEALEKSEPLLCGELQARVIAEP